MPRSGPGRPTGMPLSAMLPPLGRSKPPAMCRNVLLPQPDGPTIETNSCASIERLSLAMAGTCFSPAMKVLSRSFTSRSAMVRKSLRGSVWQIAQIDKLLDVGLLFLETGIELGFLHLFERAHFGAQRRVAIIIVHGKKHVWGHADHLGVEQDLPRLLGLFQIELGRCCEIGEERFDRDRVGLEVI